MKTKEEVKGCFNCEHEKMNHKSCNASKPCLKGSQWTKRIAPPQEVERAKVETCKWQIIPYWKFDCGIPRCIDERTAQFILGEYCPFCGKKIERV